MIPKLQKVFHSLIKSLEVLYVIEGAKPCARILVHEDELKKVGDFLDETKLNHSVSDFKALKQPIQNSFYSDSSNKIQKNDSRKGYFFVYLSKDKKLADKAKIAEGNNDHAGLGLALGYPKCCCEFFQKNFNEKNTDLALDTLGNSDGFEFSFFNNIAARHFDVSLLSHFPHSFQCGSSIRIAKKNLEILKKYSIQLAEMFCSVLRSAFVYTKHEGIFLLRKYEKSNGGIIYSGVVSTAKSKLYFLIMSSNRLAITSKNCFTVSDIKLSGKDYGIMLFT
jgi:hypothetical protein